MHDEIPAPPTREPIVESETEHSDDRWDRGDDSRDRGDDPRDCDGDSRDRGEEPPATGPAPPQSRDGVDPPDDPDADDGDEEPLAYRLERLRLWRALATLAVVVARLIRSL
ncbi:hypothetical protein [Halorubrum depositum]|uniref:hypothetical protein n=1 Tax=Halorubrum depositum TaxID=2583992 RepID=UPI0011A3E5EB|nr:hypothetical protein [Halorubrum depositum]